MAQKPDGKSARAERVTFTRPAAERIAKVVRRVELGSRDAEPLRFARVGGGGGGGVRVGKVAAAWAIGTCATVTLWNERDNSGCCVPEAGTLQVENVVNVSHNVRAGSFVVIGQASDHRWYLVASGIDGSCRQTIGGEDITQWAGWNGSANQILGHDENGCLKWFDADVCDTPPTGGGA